MEESALAHTQMVNRKKKLCADEPWLSFFGFEWKTYWRHRSDERVCFCVCESLCACTAFRLSSKIYESNTISIIVILLENWIFFVCVAAFSMSMSSSLSSLLLLLFVVEVLFLLVICVCVCVALVHWDCYRYSRILFMFVIKRIDEKASTIGLKHLNPAIQWWLSCALWSFRCIE